MMNPNRRLAAIFTPIWPAPTLQGSGSKTLREGLRKSNNFCLSSVCHSLPWQHWPLIGGRELHDGAVTAKCLDRWAGHRLRAVTEAGSSGVAGQQSTKAGFRKVILRRKICFTEPNSAVLQQNGSSQDWATVLVLSYTSTQGF